MAFEVRWFGDPVLKTRAKEVTELDDSLKSLADGMLQTLRAGEDRMAIAANQVGVLKRVFVAETGEKVYVLVNPVIEEKTPETETAVEGCLSIPGIGVEVGLHSGVVVSLAIEIAAAHAGTLSPAEILDRLCPRVPSLAWKAPDAPGSTRRQTAFPECSFVMPWPCATKAPAVPVTGSTDASSSLFVPLRPTGTCPVTLDSPPVGALCAT